MSAEELVQAARLPEALESLEAAVRAKPASAYHRFFLFQLLSVMGDWQRALSQLQVAGGLNAEYSVVADIYAPVLQCEAFRAEVFAGRYTPLVLGKPPQWMAPLIAANEALAAGHAA